MQTNEAAEVVIIGAGIAGVSLAHFLAERGVADVLVIEREAQAAYHASGRSASTLHELDPDDTLRQLKLLGGRFLRHPPNGFAENPLLEPKGVTALFRGAAWASVQRDTAVFEREGLELQLLTPRAANEHVGGTLRESEIDGAAHLPEDGVIDVHELLSSYMRHARRRGARFRFAVEVAGVVAANGACSGVATAGGRIEARWVVNAAGAWVGRIAAAAGALPIALTPLRRSIAVFAAPADVDTRGWPMVWSDPHQLYFRPEPTGLLFSPMDEEPMQPCDARPDDVVIAAGLERLRALAPRLVPRSLGQRWAGLRTFSPDRVPVVGEDPQLRGFFWLAGQGGCGIETSPALGQIAADLLTSGATDRFDAQRLAPGRFGR